MVQGEIIWVFGPAAVGKSEFIDRFMRDGALQKKFRILTPCVSLGKNLQKIGGGEKKLKKLCELLKSMPPKYSILLEGQDRDLKDELFPALVRERFRTYLHRILFLWITPSENSKRAEKRKGGRSEGRCRENLKFQLEKMNKLYTKDFQVTAIEATDSYPILNWPNFQKEIEKNNLAIS